MPEFNLFLRPLNVYRRPPRKPHRACTSPTPGLIFRPLVFLRVAFSYLLRPVRLQGLGLSMLSFTTPRRPWWLSSNATSFDQSDLFWFQACKTISRRRIF